MGTNPHRENWREESIIHYWVVHPGQTIVMPEFAEVVDEEFDISLVEERNLEIELHDSHQKKLLKHGIGSSEDEIGSKINFDEEVKSLREYAWQMQSRFHKPGLDIDEGFKRQTLDKISRI